MSLNILTKRCRLVWSELLPSLNSQLMPLVSFDGGYSFMNIDNKNLEGSYSGLITTLRSFPDVINPNNYYGSCIPDNTGYTNMDVSVGFTPYSIPKIEKLELVDTGTELTNFKNNHTYFFAVSCLNYDTPGIEKVEGSEYIYFSGTKIKTTVQGTPQEIMPISNVKAIKIPDDGKHYKVNVYVNYPNCIHGLCLYYGSDEDTITHDSNGNIDSVTVKLMNITNLKQILSEGITQESTEIKLKNKYPLPYTGCLQIDNEIIKYTKCEYNTSKKYWFITATRSSSINASSHTADTAMHYLLPNSENVLPEKKYLFSSSNGLVQHINFDTETVKDLIPHNKDKYLLDKDCYLGTPKIYPLNVSPTFTTVSVTNSNFINNTSAITGSGLTVTGNNKKRSLVLDGNTVLKTNYDLSGIKKEGSIHFYLLVDESILSSDNDQYVFSNGFTGVNGDYNRKTGLRFFISRLNNKPYVIYTRYKDGNFVSLEEIISCRTCKTTILKNNEFNKIGISWEIGENNRMKFYFHQNSTVNIEYQSTIPADEFEPGTLDIGGLINPDNTVSDCFKGYIDDWRIYNRNLAIKNTIINNTDYIGYIDNIIFVEATETTSSIYKYTKGDKTYTYNNLSDLLTNYVRMNTTRIRANISIPKIGDVIKVKISRNIDNKDYFEENKYIYMTKTIINVETSSVTDWFIYTKSLSFNDIDTEITTDIRNYAGIIVAGNEFSSSGNSGIKSYDDLKGSSTSEINLLANNNSGFMDGTVTKYYLPHFYTKLVLPYENGEEYINKPEPYIGYDNWSMEAFIKGGWTSGTPKTSGTGYDFQWENISYPINPKNIQIKFNMSDNDYGFTSPVLKNPSVIISSMTL